VGCTCRASPRGCDGSVHERRRSEAATPPDRLRCMQHSTVQYSTVFVLYYGSVQVLLL